jgi:quinol monooxygenase YgiN
MDEEIVRVIEEYIKEIDFDIHFAKDEIKRFYIKLDLLEQAKCKAEIVRTKIFQAMQEMT